MSNKISSGNRSKKLPPPPLCLPAANTTIDDEKLLKSNQEIEQNKSTINCSLSSASKECSHEQIPFVSGKRKKNISSEFVFILKDTSGWSTYSDSRNINQFFIDIISSTIS